MIARHFFRSTTKLFEVVSAIRASARGLITTTPVAGLADQPFCGAVMTASMPSAAMSTQMQPEAMQSSTKSAPTS